VKRRLPQFDGDLLREIQAQAKYNEEMRGTGASQASTAAPSSAAPSPELAPAPQPMDICGGGPSGTLRLRLRLPLGGRMELEVDAGTSAAELRTLLHERTGVPPRQQRVRIGYPPRIFEATADEVLSYCGFHDGEVVYLENTRDLFLGNLESGHYTMAELLDKLPAEEEASSDSDSVGVLFRQALQAFSIDPEEHGFWEVVRVRLRLLPQCSPAERGQIRSGLRVLQTLFDSHDPRERLALALDCLPSSADTGNADMDDDDEDEAGGFFGSGFLFRRRPRPSARRVRQGGPVELEVDRSCILGSVAPQVLSMSRAQLLRPVRVSYTGERGQDAGGLTRDFFSSFATAIGDCEPLLWEPTGRGSLQPVPASVAAAAPHGRHPCGLKMPDMYRACGRVFGLAVLHGCKLGRRLSRPFVRLLIGDELEDVESLQNELRHEAAEGAPDFRASPELLRRPLEELGLGGGALSFAWQVRGRPELPEVPLLEGGSRIPVNDENKAAWLRLLLRQELVEAARPAAEAFRAGLIDVFAGIGDTCPLLCLLGADDLLELWGKGGVCRQDVARWRAVARVSRVVERQAEWLWQVLEGDYNDELRGKVLQFSTGSSSMGREGLQAFVVEPADGSDERLPTAMTCGNMLQLPRYSCRAVLSERLRQAAEDCCSFQMA